MQASTQFGGPPSEASTQIPRELPNRVSVPDDQERKGDPMSYVDGFVTAVPNANREAYRKHAEDAAKVFKEYGALQVMECWGDDVPEGKVTSFPMAVRRKDDETVVFSWIVWPSKEARKSAWDKTMADPRMQPDRNPMPFDGKRMIYGGFEPLVER